MKKWADEINLWSSMPDGTKVWFKDIGGDTWDLISDPIWYQNCTYVVDDENAEIIKQWYDDASKVEYYNVSEERWEQTSCTDASSIRYGLDKGHKYRIRPDEPVYYWQYEKLKLDGEIASTNYMSDEHAKRFGYEASGWRKIEST